jgi:excisionase family DNA binding protein
MINNYEKNTILLTEKETAKRLSLGYSTLKRYRHAKMINFVRVGSRIAYRLSDLTTFIEKNAVEV